MAEGSARDMAAVREALRSALAERGLGVESDSLGSRGELYVMGENDLAVALFEFQSSAGEAIDSMYQGAWLAGMPPRFAVLPAAAAEESVFELLEQMRIIPLSYTLAENGVDFPDLDRLLGEYL